jgi:hypothetical protein
MWALDHLDTHAGHTRKKDAGPLGPTQLYFAFVFSCEYFRSFRKEGAMAFYEESGRHSGRSMIQPDNDDRGALEM